MKIWQFVLLILAGMSLILIVAHLWVGLVDGLVKGLRKLFRLDKKEKINWHTLEKPTKTNQEKKDN